jgi:hypothetical protein
MNIKLRINIKGCSMDSSGINILAVTNAIKEIRHARINPPSPKATSSCVLDTGEAS